MIITQFPDEVGQALMNEGSHRITYIHARGGYLKTERPIIYCITDRFIYPKIKELVLSIDPAAILEASMVTETEGVMSRLPRQNKTGLLSGTGMLNGNG